MHFEMKMICSGFRNHAVFCIPFLLFYIFTIHIDGAKDSEKKKDIRDYTDADIERLYDQWEEGDEDPLEADELPEHKRPPPELDLTKLDRSDPEGMLKLAKKGQTLMLFATVSGEPRREETEQITQLWATSLFNAHYDTQRFVIDDARVIFMLKDGGLAWEVKDYLVQQDRCLEVTIDQRRYAGKAADDYTGPGGKPTLAAGQGGKPADMMGATEITPPTAGVKKSKKKRKRKEEL